MTLLCDEDVGTGIPRALELVNCKATSLRQLHMGGWEDTKWLAFAGQNNWFVFSYDKKILTVPTEKAAVIQAKVGILFFTSGTEQSRNVLRILLNKWDTLELLWSTTQRPFARFLSPQGHITDSYKGLRL